MMNLSEEKKTLKELICMLSWREELIRYLWASGLVGFMLIVIVLGVIKHSGRPYLLLLSDFLIDFLERKLAITNDAAAVLSGLIIFICSYMISVFLSRFIYFNRKIRKENKKIQSFCKENEETLRVLFDQDWLEQKQIERKEINDQATAILKKLEETVDPTEARETKKRLKKLAKKVDIGIS